MTDLSRLKEAALKIERIEWSYQEESDAYTHIVRKGVPPNLHDWVCSAGQSSSQDTEDTARYIALANPSTILDLIAKIEWIEIKEGCEMPTAPDTKFWCRVAPKNPFHSHIPGYNDGLIFPAFTPYLGVVSTYKTRTGEIRFNCGGNEQVTHYSKLLEMPALPEKEEV